MDRKKIIIVVALSVGIFICLAGLIFLNSFLDRKNIDMKTDSLKNYEAEKEQASDNEIPSSGQEMSQGDDENVNEADVKKMKDMFVKEIEGYRNIKSKEIPGAYKDVAACADLKVGADKDVCVTAWAVYKKDPNICQQVPVSLVQDCRDKALTVKAEADKNINLCLSVKSSDAKIACISRVVVAAELSDDDCVELPSDESKICMAKVIMGKVKIADDCNNISDPIVKQSCRNNFYPDYKN